MDPEPRFAIAPGSIRTLLRLEGLALLVAALLLYAHAQTGWLLFAEFFLLPDISFTGYLFGPRAGAAAYNAAHSTLGPIALAAFAMATGRQLPFALALIWLAHVGFDRALGYGLKYTSGFRDTHLGRIGHRS
jgi:Domain of unknown function (DUF4260)